MQGHVQPEETPSWQMVVSKHIWRAVVRMMDERHTMWSQGEGENQDWWVKVPGRQISAQGLEEFSHSSKSPSLDTLGQRCIATWWGYCTRRATDEHSHQRHLKVPAAPTGLFLLEAVIHLLPVLGAYLTLSLTAHPLCPFSKGLFLLHMRQPSVCPPHPRKPYPS